MDTDPMEKVDRPLTNRLALGAMLLASSATAIAEMQATVDVGIGVSDNIGRTLTGDRSAEMASAGLQFDMQKETRRLSTDLAGELAYIYYPDDTFKSDLIGNVRGSAKLTLIEDHLTWNAEERFGQARRELFDAPSPGNLENVNNLVTGPDLSLTLFSDWFLKVTGRYGRTDYEVSDLDTHQYSGSVAMGHPLSSAAAVSLNLAYEHAMPRTAGQESFDRQAAFVSYDLQGARTTLNFGAGVSQVKQGGERDAGGLVMLELTRKVGARSELVLGLGREHLGAGSMLHTGSNSLPVAGLESSALGQTTDAAVRTYAQVTWSAQGRYTDVHLGFAWDLQSSAVTELEDQRRAGFGGGVSRQFGPRMSARLLGNYSRAAFGQVYHEYMSNVGLSYSLGRRGFVDLSGEYYRFKVQGEVNSVEERRLWLRLGYGTSGASHPAFSTTR